jgi:hypothetical protein
MKDPKSRVIKLLRLAKDREGTPEGDTAKRLAEVIMETHGISVEPEAVEFESPPEVAQVIVAEHKERQWWQEMLLVTLCDLYGGEAVPMQVGKIWRLYVVVEPEDEVDISQLQAHFDYLCALIKDLRDSSAYEFMKALPVERENAVSSFSIGAVFRISQLLYSDTVGHTPDLEQMPFMIRALKGAEENVVHETMDSSDITLFHTSVDAPNSSPPKGSDADPQVVEVIPDWYWFDCGYRQTCTNIHQVTCKT